jgi:hypothetical protein
VVCRTWGRGGRWAAVERLKRCWCGAVGELKIGGEALQQAPTLYYISVCAVKNYLLGRMCILNSDYLTQL